MPQHATTLSLPGLENKSIQAIAYQALSRLTWPVKFIGPNLILAYTPRTMSRFENEILITTGDNTMTVQSTMINGELMDLMGRTRKDVARFMSMFEEVKPLFNEMHATEFLEKLGSEGSKLEIALKEELKVAEEAQQVMQQSGSDTKATKALIGINIIMFLLPVIGGANFFSPKALDLMRWGANLAASDLSGEWWRSVTSIFLHFGIIHLAMNMVALYLIGNMLEPMIGKARFLTGYLASGILSSLVSVLWHKNDFVVSAGASGAIFGLFGIFLALLTTRLIPKQIRGGLATFVLMFIAYNIANGFKEKSGVDNAAHLGGLGAGILIGYLYYFSLRADATLSGMKSAIITAMTTIIAMVWIFQAYETAPVTVDYETGMIYEKKAPPPEPVFIHEATPEIEEPKNLTAFQQKMAEFEKLDREGLAPDSDEGITKKEQINHYLQQSMPAWDKAESVAKEMIKLARTSSEKREAGKLLKYTLLRRKWSQAQVALLREYSAQHQIDATAIAQEINDLYK